MDKTRAEFWEPFPNREDRLRAVCLCLLASNLITVYYRVAVAAVILASAQRMSV